MPWLREHNPTIDWNNKRITFNSERCTTWCLKSSLVAYGILEEEALEVDLITRLSKIQATKGPTAKSGPTAKDQSIRVRKLSAEARIPMKGTARAAGHDMYANKGTDVPASGQAIVGTGIAIGLPHNTYGRIAPRSSLAVKHRLTTGAGVIDSDYRGEVKVVLANLGDQPYRVEKGDRIGQLIIEKSTTENYKKLLRWTIPREGIKDSGAPKPPWTKDTRARRPNQKWKSTRYRQEFLDSSTEEERQLAS